MMSETRRSIRRRGVAPGVAAHRVALAGEPAEDWLVPFREGYALIHHTHCAGYGAGGRDGHDLCGPLVFCCQRARQQFLENYPHSELARADWERLPASQVISWLDAGVQVVYLVYPAPGALQGLEAAGLSGKQARQILQKQAPLEALVGGSSQILEQIAGGKFQVFEEIVEPPRAPLSLSGSSQ